MNRMLLKSEVELNPVPEGFIPIALGGAFVNASAQIYGRWHEGHIQFGFLVMPHHANPGNSCHGGLLATFADILLSTAAQYQTDIPRQFLPTISLDINYLAVAPMGSWVQGQADILKVTHKLIFSQALITADGNLSVRASGVFKRGPIVSETPDDYLIVLPGMPKR